MSHFKGAKRHLKAGNGSDNVSRSARPHPRENSRWGTEEKWSGVKPTVLHEIRSRSHPEIQITLCSTAIYREATVSITHTRAGIVNMIPPSVSTYLHRASTYGPDGATVLATALTSFPLCGKEMPNSKSLHQHIQLRSSNCSILASSDEICRFHHADLWKK